MNNGDSTSGMINVADDVEILSDPKINNASRIVYTFLLASADSSNKCKYSFNELSCILSLHRDTIVRAIKRLIEHGYISRENQNAKDGAYMPNIYTIIK